MRRCGACVVHAAAAVAARPAKATRMPALPFVKIADQEDMKLALMLNVVDPTVGGVLIMGDRGTGKSVAVRPLVAQASRTARGSALGCVWAELQGVLKSVSAAMLRTSQGSGFSATNWCREGWWSVRGSSDTKTTDYGHLARGVLRGSLLTCVEAPLQHHVHVLDLNGV